MRNLSSHRITRRQFLLGAATAVAGVLIPPSLIAIATPGSRKAMPAMPTAGQIIADHSVVEQYQNIPQAYIDLVKRLLLNVPGESHSAAYRRGCEILEGLDSRFQVNVVESGNPEPYTDQHLRVSGAVRSDYSSWQYGYGEANWYTNAPAIQHTKDHLTYCNANNLQIAAFGFGWCWDMTWQNAPGGDYDPVYQVRWSGSSEGGPDGSRRWGLDDEDFALTENHVCMDTYLNATQQYIDHCTANGYPTKVFFTTGPVDGGGNTGENGYQRHLKHEHIRNYNLADSSRILFDYADILCWNDAGQQQTTSWTDHGGTPRNYQVIHPDNMKDLNGNSDSSVGHIGAAGALRLAKALWWMLARIAGWDGGITTPTTTPTITPTLTATPTTTPGPTPEEKCYLPLVRK
jgi:hypothetical protein